MEHAGDYAALQQLREEAYGAGGNGGLGGDGSAGGVDFAEADGFSDGRKGFGGGGVRVDWVLITFVRPRRVSCI